MPLTLQLTFGDPPSTQEFPGTVKGLGDLLAQFFSITGAENFIAVNFGATEPSEDNRDFPWFKTDEDGVPIGWYSWNGTSWEQLNTNVPSGTTEQRPANAALGDLFYDTTIRCELIFDGSDWVTAAGSPGDLKFVEATTIEDAITNNPGWIQADSDTYSGRVLGAAGSGNGLTPRAYGDTLGLEDSVLALSNLPSHQHSTYVSETTRYTATGVAANSSGALAGWVSFYTGYFPTPGGDSEPFENMQPTIFRWLLKKE